MIGFEVPVRWQDLDALGHVNHAVFLSYFEEQRDWWLGELLALGGNDYVVARIEIDYATPVSLSDGPMIVSARCDQIGKSSITISAVMRTQKGELCASSRTVIVLWDDETGRSRPLSATERAVLDVVAMSDDGEAKAISPTTSS